MLALSPVKSPRRIIALTARLHRPRPYAAASTMASSPPALTIHGTLVAVTAAPSINLAAALSFTPFVEWAAAVDPALLVSAIHFSDLDMFGGSRVGFLKFTATATYHGRRIPGIVFMRGGAVSILPILSCGAEKWVLCCRQPRLAVPHAAFLELPAGMLDGSGQFSGVAAKEMEEETSLVMGEADLIDMTALAYDGVAAKDTAGGVGTAPSWTGGGPHPRGVYPSVGACDEFLRLMLFRKEMSLSELEALRGKATGCMEDGEVITLELVPYDELWRRAPDAKTLCSLYLYEKLCRAGLIVG